MILQRVVVFVDQDADGIRITADVDGVLRTGPILSPDVAREHLARVLPWITAPLPDRGDALDTLTQQIHATRHRMGTGSACDSCRARAARALDAGS